MARSVEPVAHPARRSAGRFKRWLHFNYAHQIAQATLTGQGIALANDATAYDAALRRQHPNDMGRSRFNLGLAGPHPSTGTGRMAL